MVMGIMEHWVPKAGDIFLTRNAREEDNNSPGRWNHVALYAGNYQVVEAQEAPNQVIVSDMSEFLNRYPEILILRIITVGQIYQSHDVPIDEIVKDNLLLEYLTGTYPIDMVREARKLIGKPYRKIASIFKFMRGSWRGENCVSLVRKSFKRAYHYDPGWKIPDDLLDDNLFIILPFSLLF